MNQRLFFSLLAFTLLTACGGSSDNNDGSTPDNTSDQSGNGQSANGRSGSDQTSDQQTTNDSIVDNQGGANTGAGVVVTDSSLCSIASNNVTFSFEGGFIVRSPQDGYGWDGTNFCDMDNSAGIPQLAAIIPQSASVPILDGELNDTVWSQASRFGFIDGELDENLTNNMLSSSVPGYRDGARAGDWWAVHDSEFLYLAFIARNEGSSTGFNQVYLDSSDPRDDDAIDVFIDGDNSKTDNYDGVNDFHVTMTFLEDGSRFHYGPNSLTTLNLEHATFKYISLHQYEIKIELASAGITIGKPFGFEIQLNDDDNGGARDVRFGWAEPAGSTVADSNPSVFGTVLLTGCRPDSGCGPNQLLNPSQ